MMQKKLHGVNLGGWLLLEKWMTPSLFKDTNARDEYELLQLPGSKEKIEHHRQTFITEADFIWLKDNGLNAIRVPVGYWVLEDDPPFVSATRELDWVMDMAKKYKLQVIIDLHGLKGSQNGQDHSGRIGAAMWYKNSKYRRDTLTTLEMIANRYKSYNNLWGLQVINEPKLGVLQLTLRRFYKQAYERLDNILGPHTRIIFSDAFTPRLLSGAMGRHPDRVVMDVHLYHMATLFSRLFSVNWFMNKTIRRGRMLKRLSKTQPIIIGEWSGVMRHETMHHISQNEQRTIFREYTHLQMDVFDTVEGWFYWNYKTESPGPWHFRSQVETGAIQIETL